LAPLSFSYFIEKSAVDRPWRRKFLGFSFTWDDVPKIRIAKQSIQRAKQRIREITSRSKTVTIKQRIEQLNLFQVGWCNYFALADTPTPFKRLDEWIRRRFRMCLWKQWKKPKTKVKRLHSLGVPKEKALECGKTRKKYWRIACSPILHRALPSVYWQKAGLKSIRARYDWIRQT
jgi:hypothetical protein